MGVGRLLLTFGCVLITGCMDPPYPLGESAEDVATVVVGLRPGTPTTLQAQVEVTGTPADDVGTLLLLDLARPHDAGTMVGESRTFEIHASLRPDDPSDTRDGSLSWTNSLGTVPSSRTFDVDLSLVGEPAASIEVTLTGIAEVFGDRAIDIAVTLEVDIPSR